MEEQANLDERWNIFSFFSLSSNITLLIDYMYGEQVLELVLYV